MSGLGVSVRIGGIVVGLGVYCQDWGHKNPNSAAPRQSCLCLNWGYKTPNPVHVLGHLGVYVDRIAGIGKWIGDLNFMRPPHSPTHTPNPEFGYFGV